VALSNFVTPQPAYGFNKGETFSMTATLRQPGVVVWKRARTDIGLKARFEARMTPGINELPMPLDSEICLEPDIETMRISESGH
jgi:hypothetical protein